MNLDEAKAILTVWREMDDPVELPGLEEALALAESDSDLHAWFTKEKEFDDRIASVVADVPVPSDLRDRILSSLEDRETETSAAVSTKKKRLLYFPKLVPLAASLVIIFFVSLLIFGPPSVDADTAIDEFAGEISNHFKTPHTPPITSTDYSVIRKYLTSEGAAAPPELSSRLANLKPTGADTSEWDGLVLGIVRLQDNHSTELRLFIIGAREFPDPEALPDSPSLREEDGVRVIIWTETDYLYGLSSDDAQADLARYLSD